MAEFLVFDENYKHWMKDNTAYQRVVDTVQNNTKLTPGQRTKSLTILQNKRNACYTSGDVIQVYHDGYFPDGIVITKNRVVIKIPGMTVEEAKEYVKSDEDLADPEKPITLKRRKQGFDFTTFTQADKDELASSKVVSLLDKATAITKIRIK